MLIFFCSCQPVHLFNTFHIYSRRVEMCLPPLHRNLYSNLKIFKEFLICLSISIDNVCRFSNFLINVFWFKSLASLKAALSCKEIDEKTFLTCSITQDIVIVHNHTILLFVRNFVHIYEPSKKPYANKGPKE